MNYLSLLLGAIAISFAPILVKLSSLDSASIVVYRCLIGAVFIYIIYSIRFRRLLTPPKKSIPYILVGALFFSADLYLWHEAISIVGAGLATVLANTQVFFMAILSHFILKEKVPKSFGLWAFLGVFGLYLLCVRTTGPDTHPQYALGILFGILAGALYSGFMLSMKLWMRNLPSKSTFEPILWISLATANMVSMASGGDLAELQGDEWTTMLALGVLVHAGGWLLINHAMGVLPFSLVSLGLLLQPVLANIIAYFLFDETLDLRQTTGLVLCLFAIYRGQKALRPQAQPQKIH